MIPAKKTADMITLTRGGLGIFLAWLGYTQGPVSLPVVVFLMILDWTGDALDGTIARRSRIQYHTWIGDHDLQIDMLVSAGLLAYLWSSGYVGPWVTLSYLIVWALIFIKFGIMPALGMLFQAPIYGWFIWIALSNAPSTGLWLLVWISVAIITTWPRFPNQVIPGFLDEMNQVRKGIHRHRR